MAEGGWIGKYAFQDGALAADDIGRAAMADSFVNAAKIASDAVETAKIKNAAVTLDKLSSPSLLWTGVYGYSEYGRCVYG